jgi:hypothetical protein
MFCALRYMHVKCSPNMLSIEQNVHVNLIFLNVVQYYCGGCPTDRPGARIIRFRCQEIHYLSATFVKPSPTFRLHQKKRRSDFQRACAKRISNKHTHTYKPRSAPHHRTITSNSTSAHTTINIPQFHLAYPHQCLATSLS